MAELKPNYSPELIKLLDTFNMDYNDDPYWSESSWFSWAIPEQNIDGTFYMHFRINMNMCCAGPTMWDLSGMNAWQFRYFDWQLIRLLPEGKYGVDYNKYNFETPWGMSTHTIEPLQKYHLGYERNNFKMDLVFEAVNEPHLLGVSDLKDVQQTARMHFEQPGRIKGFVELDGERFDVDCFSIRDGSHGGRTMENLPPGGYTWSTADEKTGFHMIALNFGGAKEGTSFGGYLMRDGIISSLETGTRRVLERNGPRPIVVEMLGTDKLGRQLKAIGREQVPAEVILWPEQGQYWTLMQWEYDGFTNAIGEDQEFMELDEWRRWHRAGPKVWAVEFTVGRAQHPVPGVSQPGQIVLITGTSGAGKSTASREFRDTADDLWMLYGADLVLGTLIPGKFVEGGLKASECMHIEPDDPANPMGACHMELGKRGPGLIASWHEMIAAASRAGMNVVGDHILLTSPPFLQDCLLRLQGLPVLLVALVPPEDVLDARIADNERLTEGAAAAGLSTEQVAAITAKLQHVGKYMTREIFSHDVFDLVLDSGALSPTEIVEKIRARLNEGPGEAFDKLAEKFDLYSDFWGDDPYTSMGDAAVALTINSKIADLLANAEAKAIIDKHAPGIVTEPRIAQAGAMTLEFIMPMTGGLITPEALKAIEEDLSKLTPAKPAPTINAKIADLLSDERAKAIIDKHIPGLTDEPKLAMAASMTLEFIMPMTEGLITPEALKAIEEDLSNL